MNLVDTYSMAFWGIFVVILTWLVQWFVASASKAAQDGAIPGKVDDSLSHSSFIFRAHRTFMNSMENVPTMLATSFLAILVGANVFWTGVLIWVFAVSRLAHMALYYVIATELNPSPRTYFFMIGVFSNIGLLVFCAVALA